MRSKKNIILTSLTLTFLSCFTYVISQTKPATEPKPKSTQDTVKMLKPDILAIPTDSVFTDKGLKLKPYKKTHTLLTTLIVLTEKKLQVEHDLAIVNILQHIKNCHLVPE